jgi:uncharacterized protein YbjT (DUF2867 family)
MILVVGATGVLGSEVCRLLEVGGKPVRGLVRTTSNPEKVNELKDYGVDLVQGDLRDRSSLDEACQGINAVISTASAMPRSYQADDNDLQSVDMDGQMNLIEASKSAGVHQFIYISFTADNDFPLRNAKRAVEAYLKESGLIYTILRSGYFMEAWLGPGVGFDVANAKARVFGSGENQISWISYRDVARFAVDSLDNPKAVNANLALGGPEALSQLAVIKIFEEMGGRQFEKQYVSEEALIKQQMASKDPMQQSYYGLMRWYAQGDPIEMEKTLEAFPLELTSVQDYAQQVLITA